MMEISILTIFWITLDHLVASLKAGCSDGVYPKLLMVGGLCRHQGSVGGQGVMDPRVGDLKVKLFDSLLLCNENHDLAIARSVLLVLTLG